MGEYTISSEFSGDSIYAKTTVINKSTVIK